ncbi:hypothetical protein C8R43DRAFT_1131198 [Mycena crocata]|nr:hypothetical protein C8R43DRAFT_1131198 [Mycena crocata]
MMTLAGHGAFRTICADRLLKLNLFPQYVYAMQTAWYATHANAFGTPLGLDIRHTYTKSGAPGHTFVVKQPSRLTSTGAHKVPSKWAAGSPNELCTRIAAKLRHAGRCNALNVLPVSPTVPELSPQTTVPCAHHDSEF